MVTRATIDEVEELFPGKEGLCIEPHLISADQIVTDLLAAASTPLSNSRASLVCRYLAAHFVQLSNQDGALAAETVGEATERYHNIFGFGLKNTVFGQQALLLDTTGYLADLTAVAENPDVKSALFRVI